MNPMGNAPDRRQSGQGLSKWAVAAAVGLAAAGCGPEDAGAVNLGKAKEITAEKGLERGAPPAEKKSAKTEFKKGVPAGRGSNRGN
jgi:hypothetical protein